MREDRGQEDAGLSQEWENKARERAMGVPSAGKGKGKGKTNKQTNKQKHRTLQVASFLARDRAHLQGTKNLEGMCPKL